jgi:ActR/RegA family two-component response regulator
MDKEVLLIVDDELFYARSLAVALKKDFQRRIIAVSYDEALEKLETIGIDVALLDVRLDENNENNKDGLEILEWIKENKPEIRTFVMTSYTEMGYRDEALRLGARYFFEKPIDILEMRKILSGKEWHT